MDVTQIDDMNVVVTKECPSLIWLQNQVHGYIEVVHLTDGSQMVVNDEGLLHKMPLNKHATDMIRKHSYGGIIVGPAVFLKDGALMT